MKNVSAAQRNRNAEFVDTSPQKFGNLSGRKAISVNRKIGFLFLFLSLQAIGALLIGATDFGMNSRWWSFSVLELSRRASLILMCAASAASIVFFCVGSSLAVKFDF